MSPLRTALGALSTVALLALAACEVGSGPGPDASSDAATSPNASILPAPLASGVPTPLDAGLDAGPDLDAGPVLVDAAAPVALPRPDLALSAEIPLQRELTGVTLEGAWKWRDVPPPAKVPELSLAGVRAAAEPSKLTWKLDVAEVGRLRIALTSRAFALPRRAELRSVIERLGHIVLWPDGTEYRVVAPGALRPLLGERRNDVTPLVLASGTTVQGPTLAGLPTRRIELTSPLGSVRLDLAKVPEAGQGALLLCRALVDIAGIDPRSPVCKTNELPLAAAYSWQGGGGVSFEVASLSKRIDLAYNELLVPPPGAVFAAGGLPAVPDGVLVTREELAAFRSAAATATPAPDAPGEGILAENRSDMLAYLLVDGVPVVLVPPGTTRYLIGPLRGRYGIEWRTFFGERVVNGGTVVLPARLVYGELPDAGAPDGG
jgi:hypothetical protein